MASRLRRYLAAALARAAGPRAADLPEPGKVGLEGAVLLVLTALVALLVLASIQFSQPTLIGGDGYYHTRLSAILAEQGHLDRFPWTQASFHRDHFVDKEYLFHWLLVPFLGQGLELLPKCFAVLMGALLICLLAWVMLRLSVPLPWLWLLVLFSAGILFFFRLSLVRPHLLSIPLAVLAGYLYTRERVGWAFALALLFPLCYTAAHLLPVLACVYAVACLLVGRAFPWRLVAAVLLGTLLGLALHPHRANLPAMWYIQNVEVVANAWRLEPIMGSEFVSPTGRALVWDVGAVFLGGLATCGAFLLLGARASLRTVFFFLASCGFLLMFLVITRLVEYWVPFSVLFMASAAADLRASGFDLRAWMQRHRLGGALLVCLVLGGLTFQSARTLIGSQTKVAIEKQAHRVLDFHSEALFLAGRVPAGQTVFTCSWDSFPFLFHAAPQLRYLVALDPTFMLAQDAERFDLWRRIGEGLVPDAAEQIPAAFGARWVFVEMTPGCDGLRRQASADPRFALELAGPDAWIFSIPGGAP
ncbi:MAG: hypothetical protein JXR96_00045 [Deltaproteobacteria bacterium]|nr:hypothetical protein [Deltaproteobacteria bacterium]